MTLQQLRDALETVRSHGTVQSLPIEAAGLLYGLGWVQGSDDIHGAGVTLTAKGRLWLWHLALLSAKDVLRQVRVS